MNAKLNIQGDISWLKSVYFKIKICYYKSDILLSSLKFI